MNPGMQPLRPVQMLQGGMMLCFRGMAKLSSRTHLEGITAPEQDQCKLMELQHDCGLVMQHLQGKLGDKEVT